MPEVGFSRLIPRSQSVMTAILLFYLFQTAIGEQFPICFVQVRDSNPGPVFSIPGFGIGEFLIPGSRDPGGIMGSRRYDIKNRYF